MAGDIRICDTVVTVGYNRRNKSEHGTVSSRDTEASQVVDADNNEDSW